jgi:hypothetical protein
VSVIGDKRAKFPDEWRRNVFSVTRNRLRDKAPESSGGPSASPAPDTIVVPTFARPTFAVGQSRDDSDVLDEPIDDGARRLADNIAVAGRQYT